MTTSISFLPILIKMKAVYCTVNVLYVPQRSESMVQKFRKLDTRNKGEMSPKPSVLRFLNSDMINRHSVIFRHGLVLYEGLDI